MPFPAIRDGSVFNGHAGANTTTFTISVPNHEDGDELYIVFVQDGGSAVFTLAGWTNLFGSIDLNATATAALFHRTASSEPATYTLTTTVSERAAWAAFAVANDGGFSGTPVALGTSGSALLQFVSYTTADPGCLIFFIGVTEHITTPMSFPAFTQQLGEFGVDSGGSVGVYYIFRSIAGAYDIGDVTLSDTRAWGYIEFGIKPTDDDPDLPSATASTIQRLRTYPHP